MIPFNEGQADLFLFLASSLRQDAAQDEVERALHSKAAENRTEGIDLSLSSSILSKNQKIMFGIKFSQILKLRYSFCIPGS